MPSSSSRLTPEQRRLRASVASHTRWSRSSSADAQAQATRGQAGLLARFLIEVDPDGSLSEAERLRRAESLQSAHGAARAGQFQGPAKAGGCRVRPTRNGPGITPPSRPETSPPPSCSVASEFDTLPLDARVGARRRLDAALRAEPLPDGTRDPSVPWDACPAPGELVVEVGPRNTAWPLGPSRIVFPLLAAVGARWMYGSDGWAFSRRLLGDVLAAVDHAGRPIRLRSVER